MDTYTHLNGLDDIFARLKIQQGGKKTLAHIVQTFFELLWEKQRYN